MKELTITVLVLIAIYLLASVFLYLYQRKLIFFPVTIDTEFLRERTYYSKLMKSVSPTRE